MKKKLSTIILSFLIFLTHCLPAFAAVQLTDISGTWAQKEIQYLVDQGVISGYGDGTFSPEKSVTRAEFVRIVNNTYKYNTPASVTFKDVKSTDWFYNDVRYAVAAGFISGYSDNTFRPNNNITREEVASIIHRILKLSQNLTYAPSVFDDVDASSHYNGYIGSLTSIGVMKGTTENMFSPRSNETRADTAYSIYNAIFGGTTGNTNVDGNVIVRKDSYGPSSEFNKETVSSLTVKSSNSQTTVKNVIVNGDLTIEDTAKRVYLENVSVRGRLIVNGGTSLSLEKTDVQEMDVNNMKEKIDISASSDSICYNSNIYTSCSLDEDNEAYTRGFSNVVINGNDNVRTTVDLNGQFVAVDVYAPNTVLNLSRGQIADLYFNVKAESSTANLSKNTRVDSAVVNAEKISVKGSGIMNEAKIEAANVTLQIVPATLSGSYAPKYTGDLDSSNVVITVENRNGSPVNSAKVTIYSTTKSTDDDGKVTFTNVPSGTHEYSVEKSGFTTVSGSLNVTSEKTTRTVTLSGQNKYTLTLNVQSSTNSSSVSSASVSLKNETTSNTSSGGAVTFSGLESGVYTYTITKSGYQTTSDTITISGSNTSKTVKLVPTSASYEVEFNVRDATRTPVPNATVKVGSKSEKTDTTGYAIITGLNSGNHSFTVTASGFKTYSDTMNVTQNFTQSVTLSGNLNSLTIKVIDDSTESNIDEAYVDFNGEIKKTNSKGEATFTDVASGSRSIEIDKNGYELYSKNISVNSSSTSHTVRLVPLSPASADAD